MRKVHAPAGTLSTKSLIGRSSLENRRRWLSRSGSFDDLSWPLLRFFGRWSVVKSLSLLPRGQARYS